MTIFSALSPNGKVDLEIRVQREGGISTIIHKPTYTAPHATHTELPITPYDHVNSFLSILRGVHQIQFENPAIQSQIAHVIAEEIKAYKMGF